jgi:uncharacterized tellurite resistance protein B-like protein
MDARDRFRLLTAVALVDARLEPEEQKVLVRAAKSLGLSKDDAEKVIGEMLQGGKLRNLVPPSDPRERKKLFDDVVKVVMADGVVSPQERACLARLAPPFGISPADLAAMLDPPTLPEVAAEPETKKKTTKAARPSVALAPPPLPATTATAPTAILPPPLPVPGAMPPPLPGTVPPPIVPMMMMAAAPATAGGPAPVAKKKKKPSPKTGEASCPSCGGPVEFKNARSVATVCPYCDITVARSDRGDALKDLGEISHVVEDASPIRVGSSGKCFGIEFFVLGRLQVQHAVGFWNEWFLQWADKRTGWLGEALGQYTITFPNDDEGKVVQDLPGWDRIAVGSRLMLAKKAYTVIDKRVARATGTQGETPFVIGDGYDLPYADLRREDAGFATLDYSDETPLAYVGRAVSWKDLNLRNHRRFHGW